MKKVETLTPRQYAERNDVSYTTVMNWLQKGLIASAIKNETPTGHYWEIPISTPTPDTRVGRPPKPKAETPKPKKRAKAPTKKAV